jgi:hypothetical protein
VIFESENGTQMDMPKTADKSEDRSLRFKDLAEKRTNKALEAIRVIGNLTNRQLYAYEEEQIRRITAALREAIDDVEARFLSPAQKTKGGFKL